MSSKEIEFERNKKQQTLNIKFNYHIFWESKLIIIFLKLFCSNVLKFMTFFNIANNNKLNFSDRNYDG